MNTRFWPDWYIKSSSYIQYFNILFIYIIISYIYFLNWSDLIRRKSLLSSPRLEDVSNDHRSNTHRYHLLKKWWSSYINSKSLSIYILYYKSFSYHESKLSSFLSILYDLRFILLNIFWNHYKYFDYQFFELNYRSILFSSIIFNFSSSFWTIWYVSVIWWECSKLE